MLTRRSFLRSSLAAGLGLLAPIRTVASSISPEKVVILGSQLPAEKAHWIDRLAKVLADHYAIPSAGWTNGMTKREALASTSLGQGFGLLHQFQDNQHIRLATPPVDWWLFLFPNGIEWNAIDEKPVYGMIGHVFPTDHIDMPALKVKVYSLTTRIGREVMMSDGWRAIASLDGKAAARKVNLAVSRCIGNKIVTSSSM